MMDNLKTHGDVQEYRDIKITSKRQLTIPKSFFDHLGMEESVQAFLLNDGIFLKPVHKKESIYKNDIRSIIQNVIKDGYQEDEMVEEIAYRIAEYNRVLSERVQEFLNDLDVDSVSDERDVDFNGLDIFFDEKDGETFEAAGEESKESDSRN
jgi:bifunctional DNA-binding transcriptional regulator/antitoxin component of YhaV-PrlF toxin-antitoxin module